MNKNYWYGSAVSGLLMTTLAYAGQQGNMVQARYDFALLPLSAGAVLAVGGSSVASSELFSPSTGTWGSVAPMQAIHNGSNIAVRLANGNVLAAGGGGSVSEVYSPSSNSWQPSGSLSASHYGQTMTLLPDGRVLLAGGCDYGACSLAQLYFPNTGVWGPAPAMKGSHWGATATLLADGKVLVAGGQTTTSELFDPTTNSWSLTGPLSQTRTWHAAASLSDGTVIATGGCGGGACASTEIYNPQTRTWRTARPMGTPRIHHTGTSLSDGRVLVTGGESVCVPDLQQVDSFNCVGTRTAETYDATSGAWTSVTSMSVGRQEHAAAKLPGGSVLVSGGFTVDNTYNGNSPPLVSSETVQP